MKENFSDLTGKVLIATPYAMEGDIFCKSIVFIAQHSRYGSIGFILNKPISSLSPGNELIKKINTEVYLPEINLDLYVGGPCDLEKGFFLHSNDYTTDLIFPSKESEVLISSNEAIIEDINNGKGPKHTIFMIGYSEWKSGQIETELENNLWIVSKPNKELIFSENASLKWDFGLADVGINAYEFAPSFGKC